MKKTLKLDKKVSIEIRPKAPFNFDGTVYAFPHFPTPDFEWQKGICWQTMNFDGNFWGIKLENKGTINKPRVRVIICSKKKLPNEEIDNILGELNWRYGFDEDVSEFCEKFKNDKFLKPAMKNWNGMRMNCSNSLYELLIIAIVLQNATVRRTVQMMNALLEKFGVSLL